MTSPETVWRLARKRKIKAAIVAAGSILLLGLVGELSKGVVSGAASWLRDSIDPPEFVVSFSEAVTPKPQATVSRIETNAPIPVRRAETDALVIGAGRGNYRLNLKRTSGGVIQVLPAHFPVQERNEMHRLDTSNGRWVSVDVLAREGDRSYSSGGLPSSLRDTRWATNTADWDQTNQAATATTEQMLRLALKEVGASEDGPPEERRRIAQYWTGTRLEGETGTEATSLTLPWGGAFLGHVVRSSGATPPAASPSFLSWSPWGEEIKLGEERPGDILIFQLQGYSEAPSRLLVGVMLRARSDCVEVIAGNIADRVAITCAMKPVLSVRRPSSR